MLEVKRLRQGREWNQTELAFHAGLAPSVISEIENGKRDPSARTLRKLAEALGVDVADLFPKGQAPLPDLDGERRPSLQGWIAFVGRLADRWEQEIEEREREWQAAKPAIRKQVKLVPNLHWAVEIRETASDTMAVTVEELERGVHYYSTEEALELYRGAQRLDRVVERTKPWFHTANEGTQNSATVYDFREVLQRMEARLGTRAS